MKCEWWDLDSDGAAGRCTFGPDGGPAEATHRGYCDLNYSPLDDDAPHVCADHACQRHKHSLTFAEVAERKEAKRVRELPTPSSWEAL